MTIDRFSAQARNVLVLAQQEAQRSGHPFLEIEHLLLALLTSPDTLAAHVLQELGVKLENLSSTLVAAIQPAHQTSGEVRLSPQTKKVIEIAVHEMTGLKHNYLGTEHLLLGMLNQQESYVCDLLHRQGVDLAAARVTTERIHSQGLSESMPPHSYTVPQPEARAFHLASQAPLPAGIPSVVGTVPIDSAQQQLAVAYTRSRHRARSLFPRILFVLIVAVGIFALEFPQFFSWLGTLVSTLANAPLLSWQPLNGWYPLLVLVYFVLISLPLLVISVPLAWYSSFIIPRRYGLRKGTTWGWLKELGQGLFVLCIWIWLFLEVIFLLLVVQPQTWWAWAALIQFLFSLLATRFGALRLFSLSKKLKPLPEGELTRRLHTLLARLHLPACSLFHVRVSHRTNAANAFFTGWGKGRRIILTDTLTRNFTLDEIEVILAHELGHLVHHDIWTRLAMRGLVFLGFFYLISLYLAMFAAVGASSSFAPLLVLLLLLVLSSLTMRYRRHQEYRADEFALQTTGNVQAFKSAMIRVTNMNLLVATSTRRARHPRSHPALVKRLQHADEFAARRGVSVKQS